MTTPTLRQITLWTVYRSGDNHSMPMGAPLASLNRQQKGRLAETIVIATFLSWNFEVFEPEVDDRGIDLIVSPDLEMFYRIQVKGITRGSYTFFTQRQFDAATNGGRTAALTYVAYNRDACHDPMPRKVHLWETKSGLSPSEETSNFGKPSQKPSNLPG